MVRGLIREERQQRDNCLLIGSASLLTKTVQVERLHLQNMKENIYMKATRNSTWLWSTRLVLAICFVAIGRTGLAAGPTADLAKCAALPSDRERLECYDALARRNAAKPTAELF